MARIYVVFTKKENQRLRELRINHCDEPWQITDAKAGIAFEGE